MKDIDWKPKGPSDYTGAYVGCVHMRCFRVAGNLKRKWYATVSISAASTKTGLMRYSLAQVKEDAVRLARELLIDYHTSIVAQMKRFDIF